MGGEADRSCTVQVKATGWQNEPSIDDIQNRLRARRAYDLQFTLRYDFGP